MIDDPTDLEVMFDEDEGFGTTVIWRRAGLGEGKEIDVLPALADRGVDVFGHTSLSSTGRFLIPVHVVPDLASGDTLEVDGVVWTISGDPERDRTRRLWTVDAQEA